MVLEQFFGPYYEYFVAAVIVLVFAVVAKLVNFFLGRYISRVTRRTKSNLDDMLMKAISRPLFIGILLVGIHMALNDLSVLAAYAESISTAFTIIYGLYGALFAVRIINTIIEWYNNEISARTSTKLDEHFLPMFKRITYIIVLSLALLWILGQLGIEITSLIAALGIGGLAVALALQPTLFNFFSGAQVAVDRPIKIGDFIELESGEKGTVVDIGWRSTKVRNFQNNIVVLPNSKIAESKLINYTTPSEEIGFIMGCGVAYDSDLEKVEKIAVEVAKKVLKETDGVEGFEPFMRFSEFGDSAINFNVIMRSKTFGGQYLVKHEYIKQLKKRFDKEKIEIAFPQLDVHLKKK